MICRSILLLLAGLIAGCSRAPRELALSGPTMGTAYTVKVAAPPTGVDVSELRRTIDEVLAGIDHEMSGYRSDSQIARFNASESLDWLPVSTDVARVVQIALEVSARSGGAFDVTVAPLVNAWGFGPGEQPPALPEDSTLASIRARVGYHKLHARIDAPALRKDIADLTIDLNGIAPGYAVDVLAGRLQTMQIGNFMIDIGGEVRTRGRNARGELWRIAVERPVDAESAPYAIVELDDMAVTTSGEYRHYYIRDGRRYSHTIDPRTARPVGHNLASVVVIGPATARIDAWATAYNVLGADAGYALASQLNMPVMFIERRGGELERRMTPQFERYLVSEE